MWIISVTRLSRVETVHGIATSKQYSLLERASIGKCGASCLRLPRFTVRQIRWNALASGLFSRPESSSTVCWDVAIGWGAADGGSPGREPCECAEQDCESVEQRRRSAQVENQRRSSAAFSYQGHDLPFTTKLASRLWRVELREDQEKAHHCGRLNDGCFFIEWYLVVLLRRALPRTIIAQSIFT